MKPTVIPRDQHPISRSLISDNALKVLHRLNKAGFQAYLVGGSIRDILVGLEPKDFDIATDAHPEQVHKLFRNSRLIGRRFKLVHIMFGRELIEVATFRAPPAEEAPEHKQSEAGLLLRDNVYGSMEDDALRRDFTINSLYYSSKDFCVYDYANAMHDIHAKTIKLIGDPETRYREDPVRMLRAIRFANKLQFDLATDTEEAITCSAHLIAHVSPARLFEEILKTLMSEFGHANFKDLHTFGLLDYLFKELSTNLRAGAASKINYLAFIEAALSNTATRMRQDKPVTPAFLFACLLWPAVQLRWLALTQAGMAAYPAMHEAAQTVLSDQQSRIAIPKRFSLMMKEIWEFQIRLNNKQTKKAKFLLGQSRFRAAYDFLLLREQAGEELGSLGSWWTRFQEQHPELAASPAPRQRNRKPRSRHRRH